MWSITMSPAVAVTMAQQQTLEAVHGARRARQAALAVADAPAERPWTTPRRRTARPRWTHGLVGRAAH